MMVIKSLNVCVIVVFEFGSSFVFVKDDVLVLIFSVFDMVELVVVLFEVFKVLMWIFILVLYGDNIFDKFVDLFVQDSWWVWLEMVCVWCDVVNWQGGDVILIYLLDLGICGNSYFLFLDFNNVQIVDLVSEFLLKKNLDY